MTKPARRPKTTTGAVKAAKFTTATVVAFSLTLFAGSLAILGGVIPLQGTSLQRLDVGTMLFVIPIFALVLTILVEATRIAISRQPLPQPRRQQVVHNWQPGRRER